MRGKLLTHIMPILFVRSVYKRDPRALQICCGAIKTSPVDAIGVKMGEMPLELRRIKLAMTYWVNLQQSVSTHLTRKVLEECWGYSYDGGCSFGWKSRIWAKE